MTKWLPILFLLWLLAACVGQETAVSPPTNTTTSPPLLATVTLEPAQPAVTSAPLSNGRITQTSSDTTPGLACLGTGGHGLTCLTADGQWQTYTSNNSELPSDYIPVLAVCQGQMLLGSSSSLTRFDGQTFSEYPPPPGATSPEAMACDANGGIWVAHFQGVSYYNGQQWTSYTSESLGGDDLVYGVQVTPNGTVWVVTASTIAAFNDTNWTVYDKTSGLDDDYFFADLAVDGLGRVWVSHSHGLLIWDDATWHNQPAVDYLSPQGIAVDAAGQVWLGDLIDGVQAFDGQAWTAVPGASPTEAIRAVAVDGHGRVWVGTTYGLGVYDQGEWATYRMDNSDLASNEISTIAVLGGGPALPTPQPKATGSLHGQVKLADGRPLAQAMIEICVESIGLFYAGDTPCADQPLFFQGQTDDTGAFMFTDLPAGHYAVVINTDTGWAQLTGEFGIGTEMVLVRPDQETDLGDLTLTE